MARHDAVATLLQGEKYVSLTTFRRDGSAAATPVWFAVNAGKIVIWTGASTAKVRRLRTDPRVVVAACDVRGRVHGQELHGTGRLLPDEDGRSVQAQLRRKYGLEKRALDFYNGLMRIIRRRPRGPAAYIEVSFD